MKTFKGNKIGNYAAVTTATMLPAIAFAADAPDVSEIVTYLGYAVAAIVAIGAAKLIPAAAMWMYTNLANMIKRG